MNICPFPFSLQHESPHQTLVYGTKIIKQSVPPMFYECLVGCFEFSDRRMIAKKKDGTVAIEFDWDSSSDEKSLCNEKLATALLKFVEPE